MAGRRGSNCAAAGAAMMASRCHGVRRARSSGVGHQRRAARQQGSERGLAEAQRGSGRTRGVPERLRAQRGESQRGRERGERKRVEREREKKVSGLT